MAEFAIVTGIIALIGTGTKLSIAIFDFAGTVRGAGKELQNIATEVSSLCSVLQQLQSLLQHAHFSPSRDAVASVERITQQCTSTFKEVGKIVTGLRGPTGDDIFPAASADLANRVKWTFKKSRVQMLRSTLEACKSTLSVMLITMLLAERVSQGGPTERSLAEDEQEKAVTQSLVIAQQCAVEQLEHFEDEAEREDEEATLLPGLEVTSRAYTSQRRRSKGRLVRMFSGLSVFTDLTPHTTPARLPTRSQRASLWLDDILAPPDEGNDPHPGKRRQKRLSSAGTATAPAQLLKKWTDQAGNFNTHAMPKAQAQIDVPAPNIVWADKDFQFPVARHTMTETVSASTKPGEIFGVTRVATDLISPKTGRVQSVSFHKMVGFDGSIEPPLSILENHEHDVTAESAMQSILQDYGLSGQASDVVLCVYFGGKTRMLKPSDKPLEILRQYEDMEMDPRLCVRRS